jgi:hypothetical protein
MELILMRNFTHPQVQKPKTSKSTKKLDVVSHQYFNHLDPIQLALLRDR